MRFYEILKFVFFLEAVSLKTKKISKSQYEGFLQYLSSSPASLSSIIETKDSSSVM